MPVLTPSRVAAVVVALSLLSFLWTFGLPHQLPTPNLPVINHDTPQEPPNEGGVPGGYPYVPPELRPKPEKPETPAIETPKPTPTPTPTPALTPTPPPPPPPEPHQPEDEGNEPELGGKKEEEKEDAQEPTPSSLRNATNNVATSPPVSSSTALAVAPAPTGPHCKDVRGAPNVMVVIKTSKAEILKKLPNHLKNLLSCVPNFAIFSDHAGTMEGFTVHDALEDISNSTRKKHKEFLDYEKMVQNPDFKPDTVDKELDKWKMLPMVYKAHQLRPYARFYVFIEADTSLSWTNLLQWIDRLDYRIPYYSGAPTFLGNVKFAQRGPGILLSYGAMKHYAKAYDEKYASEWEPRVGRECCGDMVLATTLMESHVEFYSAFPLLQGETLSSLDWNDRHWCQPMVSAHHQNSDEIEMLWNSEKNWTSQKGWEVPYLFKDAFEQHVLPNIADRKDEWDNLASDTKIVKQYEEPKEEPKKEEPPKKQEEPKKEENKPTENKEKEGKRDNMDPAKMAAELKDAATSPETCAALCAKTEDCMQWRFRHKKDTECHLGKIIRLGKQAKKEGDEMWTSGWMLDKIQKSTKDWTDCEEPKWKFNQ